MTQEQIDELRKLAQAATPGPRVVNGDPLVNECAPHLMTEDGYAIADFWGNESSLGLKGNERNADYIAAANPAAVLELIAEIERLNAVIQQLTAEAAEAELAKAREQKPVAWCDGDGDFYCGENYPNAWSTAVPSVVFMAHNKTSSILFAARKDADQYAASFGPAAGVSVTECAVIGSQSAPAPAVPATYEIEEQLSLAETEMINATAWSAGSQSRIHIGFAMTAISCARALLQSTPQAPAAPYGVDEEAANRIALTVYDCKNGINPEPLLYAINRILAMEAHPLSEEGQRALLQSAEVHK